MDKQGTWALTLPSQNDTLATLADVFQLGSPWKFRGTADITIPEGSECTILCGCSSGGEVSLQFKQKMSYLESKLLKMD